MFAILIFSLKITDIPNFVAFSSLNLGTWYHQHFKFFYPQFFSRYFEKWRFSWHLISHEFLKWCKFPWSCPPRLGSRCRTKSHAWIPWITFLQTVKLILLRLTSRRQMKVSTRFQAPNEILRLEFRPWVTCKFYVIKWW